MEILIFLYCLSIIFIEVSLLAKITIKNNKKIAKYLQFYDFLKFFPVKIIYFLCSLTLLNFNYNYKTRLQIYQYFFIFLPNPRQQTMLKPISDKQNFQLPKITQRNSTLPDLSIRRQKYYQKPKMTRVMYSSMVSPVKGSSNKDYLLKAYMDNRNYEDVLDEMKEQQVQRCLRQTQSNLASDRDETLRNNLIGKQAQLKFYQNYKNLAKIINKKRVIQKKDAKKQQADKDPATQMLAQTQKLGLLPCCIGLVKFQGDSSVLSINGHKYGDKYIQAISAGLKQATMIQKCQLSNNRITDKGFNHLLQSLGHEITKLDLSFNQIVNTNKKLTSLMIDPQAHLQYLNLQNNLIHDKAAQDILGNAACSRHLKYLNLRKNLLTKACATALVDLIDNTYNLEELYIGTNRIGDESAIQIIKSLQENKSIKVFDYSLNNLGQTKNTLAKAIANLLTKNKTLVHVDFSGNNFTQEDSSIIGQGLYGNKKIYGFHFGGNYGYIDSKGFYQAEERDLTSLHTIISTNIQSYNIVFRRQNSNFQPKKFRNVCWVCEGWYEQTFKFNVPQASPDGKNLVYIHFDFEQYEPRLINLTDMQVKYKTMVPPRKYKYFFTWNKQQFFDKGTQSLRNSLSGQNKKVNKNSAKTVCMQIPLIYNYEMYNEPIQIKVQKVVTRSGKAKKLVNPWDELIVDVLPRQVGLVSKKQKKAWGYKDSLWAKQWKLDDDLLTKNCFERDWKCSKLGNFIKNQTQQDKVKQLLFKNYKLIKQLYRQYSSWSPFNGDIWAVSSNAFTQFCNYAKIISKDTPLKIIDLTFITTNSLSGADWKGNGLVPERGLIRFQFMQALVRLAEQKFKKNGLADSILGSVTMLINDHLLPLIANPICTNQKWRLQKYFIEENDMLLKKYRPIFTQLYKRNSKMKVKPGNKAFMCLAEFKSIIQKIGITGNHVLQRDLFLAFNCSMMTQVDEIQNERFMRMTEIQFIQAVARCSYILPNQYRVQDIFQGPTPFHAKFEWVIHQLKTLCSQDIRSQFSSSSSLFQKNEDD